MAFKKLTDEEFDSEVISIVASHVIQTFMSDFFFCVLILSGLNFTREELLASLDRLLTRGFIQKPLKQMDIDMFLNSPRPIIFNDEKVTGYLLDFELIVAERD